MLTLFRFIGIRHMLSKPLRTSLTVIGMALGIGLSVAVNLINAATLSSFSETVLSLSGDADLSITAGELGFPESILEGLELAPGVKHAVPVIEEHAYVVGDATNETLYIMGVDMLRESAVRSYKTADQKVMDDPQVFLNQPDSLIVSDVFAKQHHLRLDSKITMASARGPRTFTVRGILAMDGVAKAFGGAMALMDIDGARVTFGKEGKVDRVDIVLKEGADGNVTIAALKKQLGPGYRVERPSERAESLTNLISSFQKILKLIGVLSVVIGLMLVGNAMKIAISERRREIGILRSLGTSRASVLAMFLVEAVALGLLGSSIGAFFGYFMARNMVDLVSNSLSSGMLMRFQAPVIHFGIQDVLRALLLGCIAAVIATFRPARNGSHVPPVEAIAARPPTIDESSMQKTVAYMSISGVLCLLALTLSSYRGWNVRFETVQFLHQIAGPPVMILLTPIMTLVVASTFSWIARQAGFNIVGRLAQDNLMREPGRTANNILTLGLGLYLVVVVSTINASFKRSIGDWADRSLSADLVVSSFGQMGSLQTQPLHESLKQKLMAIPEIAAGVSGPVSGLRFIHTELENRTIAIKAFDDPPEGESNYEGYRFDVIDADRIAVTRQIFAPNGQNVAISKNMSNRFNLQVGQVLELQTPDGLAHLTIVALVNDFASHEGVVYMSRSLLKKFWKDDLLNAFHLNLKPGVDPASVKRAIDSNLGQSLGLMVKFNSELKAEISSNIDQGFAYTRAVELAALLSGLLGMMNMMFISVLERTREIGLLRSVGMSKSQVFRTIFTESVSQGVISGTIATSIGLFLAYLWIKFSLSNVIGWTVDFHVPSDIVFVSVALGVLVAGIAGLIPAYRAAGLEIKESLNYE